MMIFNGKEHAARLEALIQSKIGERLALSGELGVLLIVLVGDNPSSEKYVSLKIKLCEKMGVPVRLLKLPAEESDAKIFETVKTAFNDPQVTGGIIQLPLPRTSLNGLLDFIPVSKDVDLISSTSIAQINEGSFSCLQPVLRSLLYFMQISQDPEVADTADLVEIEKAVDKVKRYNGVRKITVLGNGFLIGDPVSKFLTQLGFDVDININYGTGDKVDSDLLILGTGIPNLVNGDDICEKCNVLDFGSSIVDGKVVGDLNKNSKLDHLGLISLSPGGIGPVVIRFLLINFLNL
jgi:methylenetetrahydrofolate dehydrogenase (NADP+) / methenyltetrahydrofolate cyclohydrolase